MHFLSDYHVHTSYSGDSEAPMESMVEQAIKLRLSALALTDHVDYDYADPAFELIDYDEYSQVFQNLKERYASRLKLLLGVEIGFQPHVQDKVNHLLSTYDFDFVICSTHTADRMDLYTGAFFEGKDSKAAYYRYFENVLESVRQLDNFDVYGHLDFIVRYGNYKQKILHYLDFSDILDNILRSLIHRGKGIEINTSGYRYQLNQMHPQQDIIRRYRQLGGEIITVGSDAHQPQDLCSHFAEAYELLKKAGFKYLSSYDKRQVKFDKIP